MANAKSIRGTKTEENLVISYLEECQAYARYMYYSQAADKELYFPVGEIFREAAYNELHHAKVFLKMLEGAELNQSVPVDAGFLGKTVDNLQVAMREEKNTGFEFYNAAARTAQEEGFDKIASHFAAIATVEKGHYDLFEKFLNLINEGKLWKRDEPVTWRCLVCGYEMVGTEPPKVCPGCDHPYQHYVCVSDGYFPEETN